MKRTLVAVSMCVPVLGLSLAGGCPQGVSDTLSEDDSGTAVALEAGDPVCEQSEADNVVGRTDVECPLPHVEMCLNA